MKPASLLGVAIDLIVELARPGDPFPADARVGRFVRARRFLGSHDRRTVSRLAYAWLRHHPRSEAGWRVWADRLGRAELGAGHRAGGVAERVEVLGELLVLSRDGLTGWSLEESIEAATDARWTDEEEAIVEPLLEAIRSTPPPDGDARWPDEPNARRAAEMSLPVWLADALVRDFGEADAVRLAAALAAEATVDLRIHRRRTERSRVQESLEAELDVAVELTPWSPIGLRLAARKNLTGTRANRRHWIEIADEGSQVVALALDAAPGTTIVDACAGAGGKCLILGDLLLGAPREADPLGAWNRTRLYAADIDRRKLTELERRVREAEMESWVDIVPLDEADSGEGQTCVEDRIPAADLVLVDAPCSGLGTLRRNPDLKRRYGPDDVARFAALQLEILTRFAPLVKPGGRLAYSTCALLREENEDVAEKFASAHAHFTPYRSVWAAKRLPSECFVGDWIRLDPVRSRTDGFFLAQWQRAATG